MYRLMLFADTFPADKYQDLEFEDEDADDNASEVEDERIARKNFLNDYTDYELFEMHSISLFLVEVIKWANVGHDDFGIFSESMLASGPQVILEAYQDKNIYGVQDAMDQVPPDFVEGYLSEPLKRVWNQRKTKPPPSDFTHWTSLLDDAQSHKDTCSKCSGTFGFDLWNEMNWDHLETFSTPLTRSIGKVDHNVTLAKGLIARNLCTRSELRHGTPGIKRTGCAKPVFRKFSENIYISGIWTGSDKMENTLTKTA
ncbi:hypothetical protein H0H87_011893, partial [Tephrocybe sp. NHM501043]